VSKDRRSRSRVAVLADIEVSGTGGVRRARLLDLSRAGARFHTAVSVGKTGDSVELFLPNVKSGAEMGIVAEIVRTERTDDGDIVSVRFVVVEPGRQEALRDLLSTVLLLEGDDRRRYPRISRRLELRTEHESLKGVLADISQGGLAMTTGADLAVNDEITVVIPDDGGEDLLAVRARVVNRSGDRIGLEFLPMTPERRALLAALVHYYGRL
jgi:c-di-GMP-binding flagellar brake protein YcgR